MKKAILIVACVIFAIAMIGCTTVNLPNNVGSASMSKTGQASGKIILGMFGNVQAGIADAAKAGGITKIASVDVQKKTLLGYIVVTYTTTVTGE